MKYFLPIKISFLFFLFPLPYIQGENTETLSLSWMMMRQSPPFPGGGTAQPDTHFYHSILSPSPCLSHRVMDSHTNPDNEIILVSGRAAAKGRGVGFEKKSNSETDNRSSFGEIAARVKESLEY